MDIYGIGSALKACFEIYQQTARYSGRTTKLVNKLRNGDRVVCATHRDALHLESLCLRAGLDIEIAIVNPEVCNFEFLKVKGIEKRTILDHRFVELYHQESIRKSIKELDNIEIHFSGSDTRFRDLEPEFSDRDINESLSKTFFKKHLEK